MKGKIKNFIKNSKGASTVEFALTIGIFLAVVLSIFEFARMSILSAYMDLTISQAVKVTKNTKASNYDYEDEFKKNLDVIVNKIKNDNKTFKFLDMSKQNIIRFEVKYAESISDLVNGNYRDVIDHTDPKNPKKKKNPGKDAALAKYSFQYEYKPMFFWIPNSISTPIFNREVIILQEYERDKIKIR